MRSWLIIDQIRASNQQADILHAIVNEKCEIQSFPFMARYSRYFQENGL